MATMSPAASCHQEIVEAKQLKSSRVTRCLPVLRWCLYWCDSSQVAAPGKQQAQGPPKEPGAWQHHQPHLVQ